ncbi:hypothetical protein [Sorangium sp. So ce1099]|uniref:hypothetical protein n=1 Tax=Sorangium sp. So ce1099 TaxID=3133331 RepID=UPI003F6193E5
MPSPLAAWPGRAGRIGALIGGAGLVAYCCLPVLYPVPIASLAALLFLVRIYRRPHGAAATALGLALVTPVLLTAAWLTMVQSIAVRGYVPYHAYYEGLPVLVAAFAAGVAGGLGSLLAGRLLRRERAAFAPALRWASLVALALAAVFVADAALRLVNRPGLERYVASLPVLGVVPPIEGEPLQSVERGAAYAPGRVRVHTVAVAGYAVTRACSFDLRCTVSFGTESDPVSPNLNPLADKIHETTSLAVRWDSATGLVLIDPLGESVHSKPFAFATRGGYATPLFPRMLLPISGPPLSWFAVGAAGLLFAGFVQRRRRRARDRLARLAGAPAGTLDGSGWITFDEPLPGVRLPPDDDSPTGRVLVITGAAAPAATYRSARPLGAVEVVHGERDELVAEARAELVRLDAVALAAALLTAAPLVPAAWSSYLNYISGIH